MKKFEVGKTYSMSSPCDHNCVWTYTVVKRTAKTVTLVDKYGEKKVCRISDKRTALWGGEVVNPLGNYSMSPVLEA